MSDLDTTQSSAQDDGGLVEKPSGGVHGTSPAHPPQPKPTGEWTLESVSDLTSGTQGALACRVIADAHNAALAAERERLSGPLLSNAERVAWAKEIHQLREQLAAESQLNADIGAVIRDFAVELCGSEFGSTGDEAAYTPMKVRAFLSRLRSQLAAETRLLDWAIAVLRGN